MKMTKTQRTRASAVVELLILLPLLLLIIFAMLYLGHLSLFKDRTNFAATHAMSAAGDQSEDAGGAGSVSDLLFPSPDGTLTVTEYAPDSADIPETGEIEEMFDDMSQVIYSTVAVGRYVFSNGQLRFVVETHQSYTLSADGRYVGAYALLDDHIPELSTDELQNWARRNRVDVTYSFRPPYISVGRWPIEGVDVTMQYQSVVRDGKRREATGPSLGGHPIDALTNDMHMMNSGRLPDYPSFSGDESFWTPD